MSDYVTTVGEGVRKAASFERGAAEFYQNLADGFSHLPEVAVFFRGMVAEEFGHEKAILKVLNALSLAEQAGAPSREFAETVASAEKIMAMAQAYPVENLHDAYELSHQVEFSEMNSLLRLVLTQIAPREMREEFNALPMVDAHQAELEQFGKTLGDVVWRRAQKMQKVK